jgi:hypothetical protein
MGNLRRCILTGTSKVHIKTPSQVQLIRCIPGGVFKLT